MTAMKTTLELLMELFKGEVWLTLKQAATGAGMAEQTIHNQLCEGRCTLPVRKIGRRRKVNIIDLADWIDAKRGPSAGGSAPQGGAPQGSAPQQRLAAAGGKRTGVRPTVPAASGAGQARGTVNDR